ncbi:hypothetical protein GL218_07876 [Daldinia childiae]|uniref:uncharacterized protein n=1 Tax=Daldinia childiae TaxID=326645 RepID=UPI0014455CFB|nr:uncharacterized protein GL218_07876 [Daldinia childiae]KAF3069745.1 hypothetical protein GL218_07876 [Daldinia childiae]
MAEALGVAASGIAVAQIAIQVGGTVVKLKQLWDEVKDVPDDIADLMDQIDCLDPVLWEVENGFNKSELPSMLWDNLASKSTTRYCRKALENLTAMVEELNLQINTAKRGRRKIVAIKVLLKKDSIKKLERRLENAVRMLTLAQQSYLVALTQVQPDIIVQKFTTLTIHKKQYEPQETSDFASKTEVQTVSPLRHGQQDTGDIYTKPRWVYKTRLTRPNNFGRIYVESFAAGSRVLFQAPVWFSHRSWELHSIKANGAWQLNLRSYRLIPEDSKVIALSRRGSPQDIQRLFDAGLASPYDYTYCGWSLFTNVRVWLEALEQAGIDLEAYGRREHEIFVERKYEFYTAYYREMRPIGFKFGPKPEDWEFYFYEPIDDYFSEFWKLIEDPPIRVPGSWVDDDDDN